MSSLCLSFHLIYLLSSCLSLGAHGVSIQAYQNSDFTGLVWESSSTSGCNNFPQDSRVYVDSIRTDTCFIAYWHTGCESYFSEKFLPGDIILTDKQLGKHYYIESFHICNKDEGGKQLNVDITKHFGRIYDNYPDVLESYKNVCSCVNVPQHIQNVSAWSIDNHHNDLLAYYEPDCSEKKWNSSFIKAGHYKGSRDMREHQKIDDVTLKTYKIQSFGPDPNSSYFQISCKFSHLLESTTESKVGKNAGNNNIQACQCQDLSNYIEQLRINQDKFQNEILQQFRNLTAQLKHDLQRAVC